MKIIVGLGNPGNEYANTRHNFGFDVVDDLANKAGAHFKKTKFDAEVAEYTKNKEKVLLVKPTTFMNNSGEAVEKILSYFQVPVTDLIVLYDDIDLDLGTYKTTGKSSAGHKGIQSIFNHLKTEDISRFRLGIKSPSYEGLPTDVFVLQKFNADEKELKLKVTSDIIEILL